jgi:hypothetical protein
MIDAVSCPYFRNMKTRLNRHRPYLVLFLLLGLTTVALVFWVDVRGTDQVAVSTELPSEVGEWKGEDLVFCQNEKCQRSFCVSQLDDRSICPFCGGGLRQTWSLGETWLLPADTVLLRKRYVHPSGQELTVSIVVSDKEQVSIHRPEICIVAQGIEVAGRSTFMVPLAGRKPLRVRELEVFRRMRKPDGSMTESPGYFVYWFVGQGRETPYHLTRMAYTAMDRLLFSRAYRWAYIAINGVRSTGSDSYRQQVKEFVRTFYPQIVVP